MSFSVDRIFSSYYFLVATAHIHSRPEKKRNNDEFASLGDRDGTLAVLKPLPELALNRTSGLGLQTVAELLCHYTSRAWSCIHLVLPLQCFTFQKCPVWSALRAIVNNLNGLRLL